MTRLENAFESLGEAQKEDHTQQADSTNIQPEVPVDTSREQPQEVQQSDDPVKTLRQSQINRIVSRAKADAYEKAKKEYQQNIQPQSSQVDQEALEMAVLSMAEKHRTLQAADQLDNKISQAEGLKDLVRDLGLVERARDNINLLHALNSVNNIQDVIKHMSENPLIIPQIDDLARKSPSMAEKALKKISEQLASASQSHPVASKPLSRIQPSLTPAAEGKKSIRDKMQDPFYFK